MGQTDRDTYTQTLYKTSLNIKRFTVVVLDVVVVVAASKTV